MGDESGSTSAQAAVPATAISGAPVTTPTPPQPQQMMQSMLPSQSSIESVIKPQVHH